jgi:hypothetical protein
MLRKILLKVLQVFLSGVVAFAVDYAFAVVTAERLQHIPEPLVWVILILLAGGSGYGMYELLGRFNGGSGHNRW